MKKVSTRMKPRNLQGEAGAWVSGRSVPLDPLWQPQGLHTANALIQGPTGHKFLGTEAKGRVGTDAQRPAHSERPISLVSTPVAFQQSWPSPLDHTNYAPLSPRPLLSSPITSLVL